MQMSQKPNHRLPILSRRTLLKAGWCGGLGIGLHGWPLAEFLCAESKEDVLDNGIRLPSPWPPTKSGFTREPMETPYLNSPPGVIPINVGRQLFVDDFLIDKTTLKRSFHLTTYHHDTPVLRPDKPWEKEGGPTAMVFSDGVWYDAQDRLFKMWYMGGLTRATCYATSKDGLRWEKPKLDVKKGTNIVQPDARDSVTVWLDLEKDAKRRYKLFRSWRNKASATGWDQTVYFSSDGVHWGKPLATSGPSRDRNTV